MVKACSPQWDDALIPASRHEVSCKVKQPIPKARRCKVGQPIGSQSARLHPGARAVNHSQLTGGWSTDGQPAARSTNPLLWHKTSHGRSTYLKPASPERHRLPSRRGPSAWAQHIARAPAVEAPQCRCRRHHRCPQPRRKSHQLAPALAPRHPAPRLPHRWTKCCCRCNPWLHRLGRR